MANLKDKVAVVTGGGSGIGRAIAQRFAKDGAYVVIVGRKENPLKEAAAADEKISYVAGDITKTETIETIISTVEKRFGHLDILVNNAGWCPVQPITEMTIADYAERVQENNQMEVEIKTEGDLTYFERSATTDGQTFNYYSVMYRAPEAFWLLQFACESDDYEVYRPYFVSWAQSVTFAGA